MIGRGVLQVLLDVLAPQRCVGCGEHGGGLCSGCRETIAKTPMVVRRDISGIATVIALGSYEGTLRRAILALKYANRPDVGLALGLVLAAKASEAGELLVPVPLHRSRLRQRGYNQAEVIARAVRRGCAGLAVRRELDFVPGALVRSKVTAMQSSLDQTERERNVTGAFVPGPDAWRVAGATVVLIDDVVTTGATLSACARVLHEAGARSVTALCLAARI